MDDQDDFLEFLKGRGIAEQKIEEIKNEKVFMNVLLTGKPV
jgi:hypothetical protein